jgi:hypothetical protein
VQIPHTISASEAVKLIAQNCHRSKARGTKMTREEMVNLARVACKTEGIAWEGFTKEAAQRV